MLKTTCTNNEEQYIMYVSTGLITECLAYFFVFTSLKKSSDMRSVLTSADTIRTPEQRVSALEK